MFNQGVFSPPGVPSSLVADVTTLKNNELKILYYAEISAATGTITIPANAEIILGDFTSGLDAIVESIVNGKPSESSARTAGGAVISVSSFDASGNYTLSGTPTGTVALLYVLKIKAIYYSNLTFGNIIEEQEVIDSLSAILAFGSVYAGSSNNIAAAVTSTSGLTALVNNAGTISWNASTGTGDSVFATAPTFITSITTPLIIGGTAVGSSVTYKSTTGNGTSTDPAHIFTGGNNGATEIMRMRNDGTFLIGLTSPIGTEFVSMQKDQNAASFVQISNTTNGTAARAYLSISSSAGTALNLQALSASFTTSGIAIANTSVIQGAQSGGLNIGTTPSAQLSFWTNNTERGRFLGSGQFIVGGTTVAQDELMSVQKNQNANTSFYVSNTTSGTLGRSLIGSIITGGVGIAIGAHSAGYTTSGMFIANTGTLHSSQSAGLNIGTTSNTQLSFWTNNTKQWSITNAGVLTAEDGVDIAFKTTTGTKIGTGTGQKLGFWNATPIIQPTTAGAAATFVANTSGIADDTATFDGYTIGQVVKALRNIGLLA